MVPIVILSVMVAAVRPSDRRRRPRLLWGALPIKALTYTSRALQEAGYESETAVIELYSIVNKDDFDHCLISRFAPTNPIGYLHNSIMAYWFFIVALQRYDIFHYFFDGGVVQRTALKKVEYLLLKLAGKKIVLMPYGGDSFVFDKIPNLGWRQALYLNYPSLSKRSREIEEQIDRGTKYADCVVGCLVHTVNLPRVDVLPLVWYPIDLTSLQAIYPSTTGPIRIAHAPNHRGPKGTEYLLDAVERLRAEGHDVEMLLIEKKTNIETLEIMRKTDIFVDQIIFGYALAAIEGMALGKVVVTGYSPQMPEYLPFKRYSYLDECPAIPASPENIYEVLSGLISKRDEWPRIGREMRSFAERRHSFSSSAALFGAVYQKIWEKGDVDLLSLYHPLMNRGQDGSDSGD